MKKFKWDEEKNKLLKKERGVSFEEILNSTFLGAEKHQTRNNQIVLLFEYEEYVWVVPCVIDDKFIVPLGEWEKNPRLQAKTLVCLRYGAL